MPHPGRFRYLLHSDRWTWDDTVFHLHGLPLDRSGPSTDLLLDAVHPGDRDRVTTFLRSQGTAGRPASVVYRLARADDGPRRVAAVARPARGPAEPPHLAGFFVDLAPVLDEVRRHAAHAAVQQLVDRGCRLEQATGQVMLAYGVDGARARELIERWALERGVEAGQVADRLADAAARGEFSGEGLRGRLDALLHDLTRDGTASPRGRTGRRTGRSP